MHQSQIRAASHADLAGAPLLGAHPLLGVESVFYVRMEGVEFAVRIPPAAAVLDHARVSPVGHRPALLDQVRNVIAVGSAYQEGRERTLGLREIDIGGQVHAIAHRDLHVEAHLDVVTRLHSYPPGRFQRRWMAVSFVPEGRKCVHGSDEPWEGCRLFLYRTELVVVRLGIVDLAAHELVRAHPPY